MPLHQVALCTAVTGQSALYGRLVPHLSTLDLDEHIYIKGPEGCSTEAIQLCANIGIHKADSVSHVLLPYVLCIFGITTQLVLVNI